MFENVKEEHILQGINDYNEKGLPNGFGPSSTYDLVYKGKTYPPKAIMAYANYHASGRVIEQYFSGGADTECFKAFKENGFEIVPKNIKMDNKKLYKLKEDFLTEWPINRLEKLTLEEYTNLEKTSFCYWLEHITEPTGGIKGGSSYKFGIYKIDSESKEASNKSSDGIYAWYTKYGNTAMEAFEMVKNIIIQIAKAATNNNLKELDDIDIGDSFKWKIAFMYSDYKVMNIFNKYALIRACLVNQYVDNKTPISTLNQYVLNQKPEDEDYYSFSQRIWAAHGLQNEKAVQFEDWLKTNGNSNSRKTASYIRAITLLTNLFKVPVYDMDDVTELQDLYEDLIENQTDPNGKYYNEKAKSYGEKHFYSAAIKSYIEFFTEKTKNPPKTITNKTQNSSKMNPAKDLNTILYGPPGTGKTYSTIARAIKIVDPEFYKSNKKNRDALTARFNQLLIKKWDEQNGQIAFCTFHQSFSYEDFVEGIKPKTTSEKKVIYEVQNGIFKNICEVANSNLSAIKVKAEGKVSWDQNQFANARFYKLSLGNSNRPEDREIYEYCRNNNYIAIGYGGDMDYTNLSESQIKDAFEDREDQESGSQMLNYFIHYLKQGNYVLISNGNKYVRALGKVIGDYEYIPNSPIDYSHFRKVEWVFIDENIPIEELYEVGLSQKTIYKIDESKLKKDFFVKEEQEHPLTQQEYVVIVDEINRGNVSAIFGELITLIEKDKRKNEEEALEVVLPYSKAPFSVPNNLHIIGTMNTADRSVEALDTALRRRFVFKEIPPRPSLLSNITFGKFNLKDVLSTINKRIEILLDRDHRIGHSYFMKLKSHDTKGLASIFTNNIIPLLQEYFYNDYQKIALILGPGFVDEIDANTVAFPKGYNSISIPSTEVTYKLKSNIKDIEEAVLKLIEKPDAKG